MNPRCSAWLSRRLIDRHGGHRRRVLAAWAALRELDRAARPALEQHQGEALARLLRHAVARVPYFRERRDLIGNVDSRSARAALARLPIMNRADIQNDLDRFVAEGAGPLRNDATGGSTGTPMVFKIDRETQIAREASLMWADHLAGWEYGDRIAMLWGSDRDVFRATRAVRAALRWWIDNRRWYNAFDMGEKNMARFHRSLKSYRPHIIVAYAGSLFLYARYLRDRGLTPPYPLRSMVSSAEMLLPGMREVVESVFRRPVFDRYGNREAGAIAAECPVHEGLHLNEAQFILEVDSPDPVREPGPLLITYLCNYAMPFIRYNTGDIGRLLPDAPCACGRPSRRFAPVMGRQGDTIRTGAGKLIHGEYFTHLLYGARAVKNFQFVQETERRYRLLVVSEPKFFQARQEGWRREIEEAVGAGAIVYVQRVDEIPPLPSGKHKFTISKVHSPGS
jgi:phenylacetate-CoA ligase